MGTPAFPNLGKHCTVSDCRLIDFLPFTCDCCQQVYCLDHRSYSRHQCPKASLKDVTVVICPLCAQGVRLIPEEDPNITWESHINIDCDPSNYEQPTKKRKCPVPRCKEMLTFSNTIKCRDCTLDHCLKHRFGPDHTCPGPTKPDPAFQFITFLNNSRKDVATSSSRWTSSFINLASSVRASAEAGIVRLSSQGAKSGESQQVEVCPECKMRLCGVGTLMEEHVENVHQRNGLRVSSLDVCPKCSKGFRDPVKLVEHVEKEHRGVSKA